MTQNCEATITQRVGVISIAKQQNKYFNKYNCTEILALRVHKIKNMLCLQSSNAEEITESAPGQYFIMWRSNILIFHQHNPSALILGLNKFLHTVVQGVLYQRLTNTQLIYLAQRFSLYIYIMIFPALEKSLLYVSSTLLCFTTINRGP